MSAEHSIRALSDSALSSGRLKMTHHLSPEFHKHISIPLNSATRLKPSDNLLTIKTAYVMLTSPQTSPHRRTHTFNLAQLLVSLNEFSVVSRH